MSTEIKTGTDAIRAALHARFKQWHPAPLARYLGIGIAALEAFALGGSKLGLLAIMEYQRACNLIYGQASTGPFGHQCSHAPGRPDLHLVSSSRRPRRVINSTTRE